MYTPTVIVVLLGVWEVLGDKTLPLGTQSWVWETPEIYPSLPIAAPYSENPLCREDSLLLIEGIKNRSEWAMRMWDATPHALGGVLMGSWTHLGNYDSCLMVENPFKTQFCIAAYQLIIPPTLNDTDSIYPTLRDSANDFLKAPRNLAFVGICVPASCSADDMTIAINAHLAVVGQTGHASKETGYGAMVINSSCSRADQRDSMSAEEAAFWLFCIAAVGVCVISTFIADSNHESNKMSLATCFSLKNNASKMLEVTIPENDDGLFVMHALKTLCMIYVYASHKVLSIVWVTSNSKLIEDAKRDQPYFPIFGDLPCDCFLFASGVIVAFTLYKTMNKEFNPVLSILLRVVKIVPAYYFSIWMHTVAMSRFFSGPAWNLYYGTDAQYCRDNWWLNVLLLSNYIKADGICITSGWYVNTDIHLFMAAVLVAIILRRNEKAGLAFLSLLLLLATISPGLTTYMKNLDVQYMQWFQFQMYPRQNRTFTDLYIVSHNRAAIYFIGMFYGIYLHKQRGKKMHIPGWVACIGVAVVTACVIIPVVMAYSFYFNPEHSSNNLLFGSILVSIRRPLWGLCVATLLFLYHHGKYASLKYIFQSKFVAVISRLTYGIYLLHLSIIISRVVSRREAISYNMFNLIMDSIADLVLVTVLSILLNLFLQMPVQNLVDRIIYNPKKIVVDKQEEHAKKL